MPTMSEAVYEGGCLCGAVRYRAQAAPLSAPYCHCSLCRRAAGAPVVAWATFAVEDFAFTRGTPLRYASSTRATRQFCGRCGSQLTFQYNEGATDIDVTIATLDEPRRVAPTEHLWLGDRVPWLKIVDDLPRHERSRRS